MHKPPAETAPKRYNPQLFLHTISKGIFVPQATHIISKGEMERHKNDLRIYEGDPRRGDTES